MKIIVTFLITLLLTTSCTKRCVKARLEAITPSYRASYRVGTPDPLKACFYGQQIVVSWKVAKTCKNLKLTLSYITGGLKFEKVDLPIDDYRGDSVFIKIESNNNNIATQIFEQKLVLFYLK